MSCDCSHESLYHLKEKGKKIQKKRNIKSGKIDKKKKKKKFYVQAYHNINGRQLCTKNFIKFSLL